MTVHRCLRLPTLLILLLLTFTSVSASYRIVNESQRLAPESLAYPDHFGFSTAVNEKILLAGAENHGLGGAVYSFERGSDGLWKETAFLLPEDPVQNGLFGGSIALRGSTAFVGANNHPNGEKLGAGAVYVFERSEAGIWIQKAKIQPEDAGQFDNFGVSLAVEGQLLAVGSVHSADYGKTSLGAVYIFQEDENGIWQQSSKLMVEEPAVDDGFGWTLSLSGSTLFVGDPFKDINEMADAGIVYVFDRANNGNWIQHQTLTTDEPQSGSYYIACQPSPSA